jgi:hypothetical protein
LAGSDAFFASWDQAIVTAELAATASAKMFMESIRNII